MAKILIIEDDPYVQKLYERLFKLSKHTVYITRTGSDGIKKALEIVPDLILLDILMPQMNGIEVLQKLKANPVTAPCPVVILTNLEDEETAKKAIQMGARSYLLKADLPPDELLKSIDQHLGQTLQ